MAMTQPFNRRGFKKETKMLINEFWKDPYSMGSEPVSWDEEELYYSGFGDVSWWWTS